jgi:hypothetical protein
LKQKRALIRIQTELQQYFDTASSASLDDERDNIFGYMKRICCEGSSFLSSKCPPAGEAKVSHSLTVMR